MALLVGNERKIRVGEDPWLGVGERYKILEGIVLKLIRLGIYNLNQACSTSMQRETLWKSSKQLGLEEGPREEWEEYVTMLKSNFIHLEETREDKLVWTKNPVNGDFTAKLGYKTWAEEKFQGETKEWWKQLWKAKGPLKAKITLWQSLNNKILTWDNLQKRGWNGPNRCTLCI